MSVFVVIEDVPSKILETRIKTKYGHDYLSLGPGRWLVSAGAETAQGLSIALGIEKGGDVTSTIVFKISSYYGLHNASTWDWIKSKLED